MKPFAFALQIYSPSLREAGICDTTYTCSPACGDASGPTSTTARPITHTLLSVLSNGTMLTLPDVNTSAVASEHHRITVPDPPSPPVVNAAPLIALLPPPPANSPAPPLP